MKSEISHHPDKQTLESYLADRLQNERAAEINDHVENCSICLAALDQLSDPSSEVSEMLDAIESDIPNASGASNREDERAAKLPSSDGIEFQQGSRYVLLGEIARGGMGTVHRVFDRELQREVAVKVISDSDHLSHDDVARFHREARICGQLQHPGVVPIHEQGRLKDGRQFIAMKLVGGKTLSELIESESETSQQKSRLLEVFSQICQTMAYAHAKGIIHRDLKPQNIMVGSFGEVQIMDWGLAKRVTDALADSDENQASHPETEIALGRLDQTQAGSILGTPAYMAPEQILGKSTDQRADVFALGGILFEILLGVPPFGDGTFTGTVARAKESELGKVLSDLESCGEDRMLKELVKDCLAPNSNDRPDDALVVSDRLSAYFHQRDERLKQSELKRATSEARYQAERKRRRQVLALSTAIASIVLLSAGAAGVYWLDQTEKKKERESKISDSITAARQLQFGPADESPSTQGKRLTDALLRLKQSEELVDRTINENLYQDYEQLKESIESAVAVNEANAQKLRREDQMVDAIEGAIQLSIYAMSQLEDSERLHLKPQVKKTLAEAFAEFGIKQKGNIQRVQEVIRESGIQEKLMHGLILWRDQFTENAEDLNGDEVLWLDEILEAVDPDDFRAELLAITRDPRPGEIANLMLDPRTYESIVSIYLLSYTLNSLNEIEMRHELMLRSHRHFPGDFEINWQLGDYFLNGETQSPEKALRHLTVCLALQPDNPLVLLNVSSAAYRVGDHDSAIEFSKRLAVLKPDFYQPFVNLAAAFNAKGESEVALKHIDQAIRLQEAFYESHFNRSVILFRLKRYKEALKSVKRAEELAPSKEALCSSCLMRFRVCVRLNRPKQSMKALEDALAAKPRDMKALQWMAQGFRMQGNLKRSVEIYRQLVEYHPNEIVHHVGYAQLLIMSRRYEEAEEIARHARSRGFVEPELGFIIAHSIARQGKTEQATALLSEFIEQYPKHGRAKKMLADLKDGQLEPIR